MFSLLLLPLAASAGDAVKIDGIWYILDAATKQAEVTTGANFDLVLRDETDGATAASSTFYTGSVDIPASVTYDGEEYCVTGIGENAFRSCYNLTSVTIPGSVTKIEE